MDNPITHSPRLTNYEAYYNTSIRPKLEAIDIFLKENTAPFHIYEVAQILEIDTDELCTLMQKHHLRQINHIHFFTIALEASSHICQLLSMQWHYSDTKYYTPKMISEIYMLNIHKVKLAFAELGKNQITDSELVDIFKRIHLTIF